MTPSVVADVDAVDDDYGGTRKTAGEVSSTETVVTARTRSLSSSSSLLSASLSSSSTSSSKSSSSFEMSMFRCLPYDYKFLMRLVQEEQEQQEVEDEEDTSQRNDQSQKKRLEFLYGCPSWSQLVPVPQTKQPSLLSSSTVPAQETITSKTKMVEGCGDTHENGEEKQQDRHQRQVDDGYILTDETLDLLVQQYKKLMLRTNNGSNTDRSGTGNKVTFDVPCVRFHDTTKPCERWSVTLFFVETTDGDDDNSSDDGSIKKEKKECPSCSSLRVGGLISKQDCSYVPANDLGYEELEKQKKEDEDVKQYEHSTFSEQTATIEDLEKEIGHLRALFQHLPSAYSMSETVTDEQTGEIIDHRYIEVNRHFEDMSGLKDVVGKRWTELIPGIESDPGDWIGRTACVASGGEVDTFTRYSERQERWFRGVTYSPSKGKSITMFTDITEERQLEKSLLESEENTVHCLKR